MGENSLTVRGKKWERKNSLWILWSLFTLAGVGFIKIGRKAKEKKWIAIGIFYLIFLWGSLFVVDILDEKAMETYSMIYCVVYIGSIVHSFIVKKSYLIKYDKVLHKKELELEDEKIKRNLLEQEKIQQQKNIELEKMKILQEYEQAKINNEKMDKNSSTELNEETSATTTDNEKVIYHFKSYNNFVDGMITFYEEHYKFVSEKGELIENKYSNLMKIEKGFGSAVEIYDKNNNLEIFGVKDGLLDELMEFINSKISVSEELTNQSKVSNQSNKTSKGNTKKQSNEGKIIVWIVLPVVLFLLVGYAMFVLEFGNVIIDILLLIFFMIWAVIGVQMYLHTCPECNEWNGLKEINRQLINTKNITIKKTVNDKVYAGNNPTGHGQPQNYVKKTVYVPGTEYTYNVGYRCEKCGYVEYRTETKKVEN